MGCSVTFYGPILYLMKKAPQLKISSQMTTETPPSSMEGEQLRSSLMLITSSAF